MLHQIFSHGLDFLRPLLFFCVRHVLVINVLGDANLGARFGKSVKDIRDSGGVGRLEMGNNVLDGLHTVVQLGRTVFDDLAHLFEVPAAQRVFGSVKKTIPVLVPKGRGKGFLAVLGVHNHKDNDDNRCYDEEGKNKPEPPQIHFDFFY